jgi:hypothetical protein
MKGKANPVLKYVCDLPSRVSTAVRSPPEPMLLPTKERGEALTWARVEASLRTWGTMGGAIGWRICDGDGRKIG